MTNLNTRELATGDTQVWNGSEWLSGDNVNDYFRDCLRDILFIKLNKLKEEIQKLDYYWQREHPNKVLVRLEEVLTLI